MRLNARLLAVSGLVLALAFFTLGARSFAADEKDPKAAIQKLADALENKDANVVKPDSLKDTELEALMALFKPRIRKGYGYGKKPGVVPPNQDGIEFKIGTLSTKPLSAKDLEKQGEALAQSAYVTAAIASVIVDKCPVEKKEGDKDPKKWKQWATEMNKAAKELAEAAKAKNPKEIKAAASKVNASCTTCHAVFRD